jgi:hypothetical protein
MASNIVKVRLHEILMIVMLVSIDYSLGLLAVRAVSLTT